MVFKTINKRLRAMLQPSGAAPPPPPTKSLPRLTIAAPQAEPEGKPGGLHSHPVTEDDRDFVRQLWERKRPHPTSSPSSPPPPPPPSSPPPPPPAEDGPAPSSRAPVAPARSSRSRSRSPTPRATSPPPPLPPPEETLMILAGLQAQKERARRRNARQ